MNSITLSRCVWLRTMTATVRRPMSAPRPSMQVLSASSPCWRNRRISVLLLIVFSIWGDLSQTGSAHADPLSTEASDKSAGPKVSDAKIEADIGAARKAIAADPATEAPVRNLVDILAGCRTQARRACGGRSVRDTRGPASVALSAQRGFLRRQLNDPHGAAEDFTAALAGEGLTQDQRRNVQAGLDEAQAAQALRELDRAQSDMARGDFVQAAEQARLMLERNPNSESAMRIRVEALSGAGRKQEALLEADRLVKLATTTAALRAQRGFLRRGERSARSGRRFYRRTGRHRPDPRSAPQYRGSACRGANGRNTRSAWPFGSRLEATRFHGRCQTKPGNIAAQPKFRCRDRHSYRVAVALGAQARCRD